MLVRTTVRFCSCQVWLEADTAKVAKRAAARFSRWFLDMIGEPQLFLGDPKRATAATRPSKESSTKTSSSNPK